MTLPGGYHVRGGHRMILLFRGVCAHEVSNGEVVAATFDAVSLRRGLGLALLLPRSFCSPGPTATYVGTTGCWTGCCNEWLRLISMSAMYFLSY